MLPLLSDASFEAAANGRRRLLAPITIPSCGPPAILLRRTCSGSGTSHHQPINSTRMRMHLAACQAWRQGATCCRNFRHILSLTMKTLKLEFVKLFSLCWRVHLFSHRCFHNCQFQVHFSLLILPRCNTFRWRARECQHRMRRTQGGIHSTATAPNWNLPAYTEAAPSI